MNRIKKLVSVVMIFTFLFAFTGCFFFSTDQEEFKDALKDVLGVEEDQYYIAGYSSVNTPISGCVAAISYIGPVACYYYEFDNSKNAHSYFVKQYEMFEADFEYDLFNGEYQKSESSSRGYIYLDGTAKAGAKSFIGLGNIYGGLYFQDKTVVLVVTSTSPSLAADFIDAIDYPHI